MQTGKVLKVGSWAGKAGTYWQSGGTKVPHNQLLASVANAFGASAPGFGDSRFEGRLTAIEG